jgi:toxin ParE1/3/4
MAEAAGFYEGRVPGLGRDFLTEIGRCFDRISAMPESGQLIYGRFRRRLVIRFPYSVVYELLPDAILVVAIAHQSQRPGYWRQRR